MKRVAWSIDEAVILHDAYLRVIANEISRKNAISEVSEKLRKMAQNAGLEIDDKYRNTNGIAMQLSIMEFVITNGQHGLGHPPKVFFQAVELYNSDHQLYSRILARGSNVDREEKRKEDNAGLQTAFVSWLIDIGHTNRTSQMYFYSVRGAEKYAHDHSFEFDCVITDDLQLCTQTVEALFNDEAFMTNDHVHHHRFSAALK